MMRAPDMEDPSVRRKTRSVAGKGNIWGTSIGSSSCPSALPGTWYFARKLARDGHLSHFAHRAFWQRLDTLREKMRLEVLWAGGKAPWKVWK